MEKPLESDKTASLWPLALLGILLSWFAHQSKTVHPQDDAETAGNTGNKQSAAIPDPVPPPPKDHKTKTACRPDRTPWWRTFGEGVAICTGLGLLIVNIYQMEATKIAADAAKISADLTRRSLARTSAASCNPIVQIRSRIPYLYFLIDCEKDRFDATILNGKFEVSVKSLPSGQPMSPKQEFTLIRQLVHADGQSQKINFDTVGFSETDFYSLRQSITIEGFFEYDDGFDRTVPAHFCIAYLPSRSPEGIYTGAIEPHCDEVEDWLRKYRMADKQKH